jgi:hypothetical protein
MKINDESMEWIMEGMKTIITLITARVTFIIPVTLSRISFNKSYQVATTNRCIAIQISP